MVTRENVWFASGEAGCDAWLYLPAGASAERPVGGVVMAHGLGATKALYLDAPARAIAARGLAVLCFDYRYYGASGGAVREQVIPAAQIEDYRNALTALGLRPEVDAARLGVWGTSFSGGHVLHLGAHDPRVKAVVSQVPGLDIGRTAAEVLPPETLAGFAAIIAEERTRTFLGGDPVYIPLAAPAGEVALQPSDEGHAFLEEARRTVAPGFRNRVTLASIERVLEHAPGLVIDRIAPRPLLMILARGDTWTSPGLIREAFARAGEPKALLELEGTHYDVYTGPAAAEAASAAAEWFARHLGAGAAAAVEETQHVAA